MEACLQSIREADLRGLHVEVIYVDGGSTDNSRNVARAQGVDAVLGGDRKRRAAENRNLGLDSARGRFVQFLDGDMVLDGEWVKAALAILEGRTDVAVVFGRLEERNQNVFYRALQIDWQYPEGEAQYCGGASLVRAESIRTVGGFPEDVAYGEEPLLCWRVRNDLQQRIYHLHHRMAWHDLAYRGFGDYWSRTVRVGKTYAEIAARCRNTQEPFWSREVRSVLLWGNVMLWGTLLLLVGPWPVKMALAAALVLLLGRKIVQHRQNGWAVATVYALHTYLAKLAIACGVGTWYVQRWRRAG